MNKQENKYNKTSHEGRFVYLNPFLQNTLSQLKKEDTSEDSLLEYSGEILNNFIATSRARRLREFKNYSSDNTVRSTSRSFPLISTQMGSFFGFIDQDFRKYDFYIGMLDAWFYINGLIKREGSVIKNISRSDKQWAPFHCLQSFSNSKRFMGKCSLL